MERDYRIDLLRILACLMVVFIHVSAFGMLSGVGSFNWHIGNIYDSLVRSAVPLFVMISGAFLLSKNISYKEIFSKYILRILIIYIIWCIVYAVYSFIDMKMDHSLNWNSISFIINHTVQGYFHLWYLPMLCILYLITPFLRKIVKDNDSKLLEYGFFLFLFAAILKTIVGMEFIPKQNIIATFILKFPLDFILQYYSYYLLGYYLYNSNKFKGQKRYYIFAILSFIGCIIFTYLMSNKLGKLSEAFYGSFVIFTVLEAVGIFLFFKYSNLIGLVSNKLKSIIKVVAPATFGIYLIHILVLNIMVNYGIDISVCNPILSIPLIVILVFMISFIIIYLIKKIPIISKYLC